jgi:toxin ParE1/3/4
LSSAEDDANDIVDHIDAHNPIAAWRIIERIEQAVKRLGTYPFVGRSGAVTGTRELVVRRTPYIVIYTVGDHVEVHNIVHTSRRWPPGDQ